MSAAYEALLDAIEGESDAPLAARTTHRVRLNLTIDASLILPEGGSADAALGEMLGLGGRGDALRPDAGLRDGCRAVVRSGRACGIWLATRKGYVVVHAIKAERGGRIAVHVYGGTGNVRSWHVVPIERVEPMP